MLLGPFLTEVDSRASIKGSRDPLGIQPIWTRFGRLIVGNLTMASSSVRDFTSLLLGLYFAKQATDKGKAVSTLETFLKWEQLSAYARYDVNGDGAFRGIERVKARLSQGVRLKLSAAAEDQILADQKSYGIWGLYTVPARSSGLVDGEQPRLSAAAYGFVESSYIDRLKAFGSCYPSRIIDLLSQKISDIDLRGKDRTLIEAIASILKGRLLKEEISFYRDYLLHGGPGDTTRGLQRRLARLLRATYRDRAFGWSPSVVRDFARRAAAEGDEGILLDERLSDIRHSESVLAPVSALFSYLLDCQDAPVSEITERLSRIWGKGLRHIDIAAVRGLRDAFGGGDPKAGGRWITMAESLARGEYDGLLELVLEQNRSVMSSRGGSPWIEKAGNKLDVRIQAESEELPKRNDLVELWRFPYFLDALRNIGIGIEGDLR